MREFLIINPFLKEDGTFWIHGRTIGGVKVGDVAVRAIVYEKPTRFEEYIQPPKLVKSWDINFRVAEIESYEKKLESVGDNTEAIVKVECAAGIDSLVSLVDADATAVTWQDA